MSFSSTNPITVVVIDDRILVAEMVAHSISKEPDMLLAGTATNMADGIALIESEQPNVVLIDDQLPDGNSIEAVRRILKKPSNTQFVLLSSKEDRAFFKEALAAGCVSVIAKDLSMDDLLGTIRNVARF